MDESRRIGYNQEKSEQGLAARFKLQGICFRYGKKDHYSHDCSKTLSSDSEKIRVIKKKNKKRKKSRQARVAFASDTGTDDEHAGLIIELIRHRS